MHLGDCALGVVDLFVRDVCYTPVDVDCAVSLEISGQVGDLTGLVHGHREVFYDAIFAEYLADVFLFDVPSQCFNDDLSRLTTVKLTRLDQKRFQSCRWKKLPLHF